MMNSQVRDAVLELSSNPTVLKSLTPAPTMTQTGDTYLQINLPSKGTENTTSVPKDNRYFGRELTQQEKTGIVITILAIAAVGLIYKITH